MQLTPAPRSPDPETKKHSRPTSDTDTAPGVLPEIDLSWWLLVVERFKWALVAGLLFGFVAGFSYASAVETRFEAVTTLMIMQAGDGASPVVSSHRLMMENMALADKLVNEMGLAPQISAADLLANHIRTEEVRGTNIVRLRATFPDAAFAAKVANRLAEMAVGLNLTVNQANAEAVRQQLAIQRDDAEKRLAIAERTLQEWKQSVQLEVLRKDVDSELTQRGDLLGLMVSIESERARVKRAEEELGRRQPTTILRRTIDADAAATEKMRSNGATPSQLLGMELQSEEPNVVFNALDRLVAEGRLNLAGMERRLDSLVKSRGIGKATLDKLTVLYSHELKFARYQADYDLARTLFNDVSRRYEDARVRLSSERPQLLIIDPALVPEDRISRQRLVSGVLGGVMGVLMTLGVVLLLGLRRHLLNTHGLGRHA